MTIRIIKDPYCDQVKTKKLIKDLCNNMNLTFRSNQTHFFSFTIIKLIPYKNTGFIFKLLNGKYSHKYICDGAISEDNVIHLYFQPEVDKIIIDEIIYYMEYNNINVEITYPCNNTFER